MGITLCLQDFMDGLKNNNMNIAYAICTLEYLSFAESLGQSLLKDNINTKYYIFLLTKRDVSSIYKDKISFEIIDSFHQPSIFSLDLFDSSYSDFELCCALKPSIANYLLSHNPSCQYLLYFDTDILIYNSIDYILEEFRDQSVLFCPHFVTPTIDEYLPSEKGLLNAGIYNAGFFAVKNDSLATNFLDWWSQRLTSQCKVDFCNGMFVDQLWLNLAPVYFPQIKICKNLGINAAYWNLHERFFELNEGRYIVNSSFPLIFFHYSGFDINSPSQISKHQNRFDFNKRADILPIYQNYINENLNNGYKYFNNYSSSIDEPTNVSKKKKWYKKFFNNSL